MSWQAIDITFIQALPRISTKRKKPCVIPSNMSLLYLVVYTSNSLPPFSSLFRFTEFLKKKEMQIAMQFLELLHTDCLKKKK